MGRYYYSKKEEADGLHKVEISFLKKHGFLTWWNRGNITWTNSWSGNKSSITVESSIHPDNMSVRLIYSQTDRNTGEKKDFDYKIALITTSCYFGGKRYWFKCNFWSNGVYCGRRVGVLYLGGKYFACRHCYNLTYNSRNLGGISKAAGQVISFPELDRLESEVKRKYYAGKMTKKYMRFLKKEERSLYQLQVMAGVLDTGQKRVDK